MNIDFCFATFCFGDRYYSQTNTLINDLKISELKPNLIVITDNPDKILIEDFVKVFNVSEYSEDYLNYANNYYDFDFSVKRFTVKKSFELGYNKIILVDTDIRVNYGLFTHENISNSFEDNSILGPVTYNFDEQITTNSELGRRLMYYENHFGYEINKNELNFMPEDCIQYLNIDTDKMVNFLNDWDNCIQVKNSHGLRNIPAGNIDEMCFSAIKNGVKVGNNSNKSLNIVFAQHDKWY
jgi:hypothetical protein